MIKYSNVEILCVRLARKEMKEFTIHMRKEIYLIYYISILIEMKIMKIGLTSLKPNFDSCSNNFQKFFGIYRLKKVIFQVIKKL